MKKSAKRILSVVLVLALVATMVSGGLVNIARANSTNLLLNSGFEEFAAGSFTNWTFWGGNNGNTLLEQVDGRTDKAAKITVDNNNNTVNLYQPITLDTDKEYILSAWVKTENIALQWGGANGVYLSVSDGNGMASLTASSYIKEAADWQKLEITVNGSDYADRADGIYFDLRGEFLTGTIYIDDVSLTVKEEQNTNDTENLLLNSGLEEFSAGAFTNWTFWGGNNGNTLLEQVDGRTDKAAKITVDNNNNTVNLYQPITLDADKEYILSAWVKTENIALQWGGANGVYLSVSDGNGMASLTASSYIKEAADWQKLEITVNGSDYADRTDGIYFDLRGEFLTGTIYIDDVSLTEKSAGSGDDTSSGSSSSENTSSDTSSGSSSSDSSSSESTSSDTSSSDTSSYSTSSDTGSDDTGSDTPETTEPLKNTGFEEFSAGSFANWTFWGGNFGSTLLEQTDGRTGKAAKITVDNNNNITNLYQAITLDANKDYVLSVWVKTEDIALMWTGAGVCLAVSDGNGLVKIVSSDYIREAGDWQKLEITVSGSDFTGYTSGVFFDLRCENITGTVYVDDASLTEKSAGSGDDTSSGSSSSDNTSSDTSSDSSSSEGISSDTTSSDTSSDSTSSDTGSDTPETTEPLKNTGFEEFTAGNFVYWNLWKGNHGNTTIAQVDGKTGKAAKITVRDNSSIVNLSQGIVLDTTKKYSFSIWVKTENIVRQWETAPGVYLTLRNNNQVIAKSSAVNTDANWQKLEFVFDAAALQSGDKTFDLTIEYVMGDIYLDDAALSVYVGGGSGEPDNEDGDDTQGGETDGSVPEEEDNAPLKNSGFEKFENNNFNHWTFWPGNKGNTKLEQTNGRTDKGAKLVIDNDGNIVRLYQEVKLDPTKEYTFSVWVKTENTALQWATAPGVYVNLNCNNNKILASEAINKDSDWTKLSVVINGAVLSGDEWSVSFDIAAEFIKGDIYIDDATLEITGEATPIAKPDEDELLKNNSFEIFSAGNFANWITWKGNKGNTKFEQVDGRTGKAAKITVDDNNNVVNLYQEIDLDPTKEYTFSVWVKTEDIKLQWAGAQGVYLNFKYNNTVILMSKPVAGDSDWTKLELKVNGGILQGNEWGVSLDVACEYLTGVVYVDDASVKVTGEGTKVPAEDPEEKLYNSGFELYSGYNFAKWNLNKGNNGNTLLSQVKGKTGNAAKIVVDDNNNIVSLYQGIILDPTKEYAFTVWVKTENIALQWAGAEGIYLALGYNNTTPVRSKAIKTDSDWTKLEVVVGGGDIPADAWGIQFAIMAEFLTGTIYIDDASMRITGDYVPKPDSYLENGGFETYDEDTIIAGWNAYAEDLFSVLDRNTDKTKDSIASASIFNSDNKVVSYWEQVIENLDNKKAYLLKGDVFSDMIVGENGGAAVFVEFYDPEGHLIRTYRTDYVKGEQTDWTSFEMKLVFPENCFRMVIKAALIKAVGTAYFDNFTLTEFDENVDTATEGTKENMYFMGIKEDETPVDTNSKGIPVFVWIIAGGVLLLAAAATIVFIVISKKKKMKIYK